MRKIYYWVNGTWCDKCDLPYMNHLSDDFSWFEVSFEMSDEDIDRIVAEKIKAEGYL